MKNQKLTLEELNVQSFVTDFAREQNQTAEINGGLYLYGGPTPDINPILVNPDIFAKTQCVCTHHCGALDTIYQPPIVY
ncbi:pinensin family lanthipeptide [Rhodocytophaga aerolata]|uniref:Pinensin family lanthipeptide n=1 Tax=Rhodocytophaga aerolata TaxID=455078 RepID=A0ABT8R690_9BACT|nr:pinensin family lanthipeptide [Rhodocytophaga aerolata]MDO1446728.1 pinensin family lanthipeptide [Rhodocytophaga aerolata]